MKYNLKVREKQNGCVVNMSCSWWKLDELKNEVNNTKKIDVGITMTTKVGICFTFYGTDIYFDYTKIPTNCNNLSFVSKTKFGMVSYYLRLTKKTDIGAIKQYISCALKDMGINDDIDINITIDKEIYDKIINK